jgi:signal transduction histidine kinase
MNCFKYRPRIPIWLPSAAAQRKSEESAAIANGAINGIEAAIIFLKDFEGIYRLCNDAFKPIAGRNPIGLTDADLAWTPEQTAKYRAEDAAVISTGEALSIVEQIGGQPDSHWYWTRKVRVSIEGRPAMLGISFDVDELIQARKTAEDAKKSLEQNLIMWRHDILTAASGPNDMLNMMVAGGFIPPDEFKGLWNIAIKKAKSAYELISQTREALTTDLKSSLNIGKVPIKTVWEDIKIDYSEYNVIVPNDVDDIAIAVDYQQFKRALYNLINNGIRYSNPPNEVVSISAMLKGGQCVFLVEDNGVGIAEEDQGKVLQGVLGIAARLRSDIEGNGLGLESSRRIAEAHDGKCRLLRSALGHGSIFAISFPVSHE